jgi:tetratricopeptide (TPR) repeat protein
LRSSKIDPDNIYLLTNKGIYLVDNKGMYTAAIPLFDQVLKKDPNNVQAIYYKAKSMDKLGRSDEANTLFETAKNLDPQYKM